MSVVYVLSKHAMRVLAGLLLGRGLTVRGLGAFPPAGPVLLVSNHVGAIDPALSGMFLPRNDIYYLSKQENFGSPLALFLRVWHGIPIARDTADRRALRQVFILLEQGHVVVMFPEGTRSLDGRLQRPLPGVGFIARRSGVPIVPLAIRGSQGVVPKGRFWPRRAQVELIFGEPFQLHRRGTQGRRRSSQGASDEIMARVAALLPADSRGIFGPGDE